MDTPNNLVSIGYINKETDELTVVATDPEFTHSVIKQLQDSGFSPFIVKSLRIFGKQTLLESTSDARLTLSSELKGLANGTSRLLHSSFIPFASPSPSSTEAALKRSVKAAAENIDNAITFANMLRY